MTALIAVLTDFGGRDTYVGQMHAVLATDAPTARVIDLTHAIAPQNVAQGAVVLADAVEAFPPQTIFLAVVDPGVGSDRRAIAAEIGPWRCVGPDNGLFSGLLDRWPLIRAVTLENAAYRRSNVSATFHGRDLFAPAAAALANGVPLEELGPSLTSPMVMLPSAQAVRTDVPEGPSLTGTILWADHYGNLLTSITVTDLRSVGGGRVGVVHAWGSDTAALAIPFVRCYSDAMPGTLIALLGSSGRLELAIVDGSAADHFGRESLSALRVRWSAGNAS
jgi:S-adenosylmethionine hydrolase